MYSKEFAIPEGVNAEVSGTTVKVSDSKNSLERKFEVYKGMKIEKKENKIIVSSESERRESKALVGSIIAHAKNMCLGVTKGFTYRLRLVYSHFPVTAKVEKDNVVIQNFLGERTSRIAKIIHGVNVKIEGADIVVSGMDVESVGKTAANLERATRITGYDKKIFQDGIYLVSREG